MIQLYNKFIPASERIFIINFHSCDNKIYSFFVKMYKTYSFRYKKLMPGMFKIMLIIGIIDNPLNVTFIIPYCKFKTEYKIVFVIYDI